MLNIVSANEKDKWNSIVKSYSNWDIYYLCEYAKTFQLHGDGIPFLIEFGLDNDRFCYVVMRKDIAEDNRFSGQLDLGVFFDYETPYGYGGPLCDGVVSEETEKAFQKEIYDYAHEHGIVSQFVRFHPMLRNHEVLSNTFETRYLHQTVFMDTASPELIMKNMDSKNRNMVRKAEKNGVEIIRKEINEYKEFMPIYNETMNKDNAADYYYFKEDYFREQSNLRDNACIFYAVKDGIIISAAIMYFNDRIMHYHLAGTRTEYRQYSPNNLLLCKAACWASEHGISQFFLGGGMEEDDNLFGFKKQFNKNGKLPFYIGRTVFDNNTYKKLLNIRVALDEDFDPENNRMIQYRA